jgi:environmental stress-induced protein Ves
MPTLNIKITAPDEFILVPWKNGLGHTTELAISDGGSLNDFAWRLSIASVINDGDFSNFSGYQRNLVLIEGNGLILDHRNGDIDKLTQLLDIARFDGASKTHGALINGGIKDFNVITNQSSFTPKVNGYIEQQTVTVTVLANSLLFAYSLADEIRINISKDEDYTVDVGHLIKLSAMNERQQDDQFIVKITGKNMIIIQLKIK